MYRYIYHGDKLTDPAFKKQQCNPIIKNDKCIRGRNSNMLVVFESGINVVVLARTLRYTKEYKATLNQ